MTMPRALREDEKSLLKSTLAGLPEAATIEFQLDEILVEDMTDGMGSLRFVTTKGEGRHFGRTLVERQLIDEDGVPVLVTINLDSEENLYEMDIWKVDFTTPKRLQ